MKGLSAGLAALAALLSVNGCGGGGGGDDQGPTFYALVGREGDIGGDYTTYRFRLGDLEGDPQGTAENHFLNGLDERPATGELYTYDATSGNLYKVSKTNGSLTLVGAPGTIPEANYGMDFNPVADRIRLVGHTSDDNFRVNPNSGALAAQDTDLNPATDIGDVAYTNNVAGAATTTLYGIRTDNMSLVTIGGIDSDPTPNGGQVFAVGPLGLATAHIGGFDIAADGTAYLVTQPLDFSSASLYTVNLNTGAATLVGTVDTGEQGIMIGFTVEN